jgi:futalosine hydrolase
MRILLVAATIFEIRPFLPKLTPVGETGGLVSHFTFKKSSIDVLIPGIGMMQTAFHLGKQTAVTPYDIAINAGIGGSYTDNLVLGEVVHVTEECIPEMGADDGDDFISLFDLGLMDPDNPPYVKGRLVNVTPFKSDRLARIRTVKGATANTIHDNLETFRKTISRYEPETESMEGAAFLYSCLTEKIPCAQIRSISNYVAERDKTRWNVELAFKNLNEVLWEVVKEIVND